VHNSQHNEEPDVDNNKTGGSIARRFICYHM